MLIFVEGPVQGSLTKNLWEIGLSHELEIFSPHKNLQLCLSEIVLVLNGRYYLNPLNFEKNDFSAEIAGNLTYPPINGLFSPYLCIKLDFFSLTTFIVLMIIYNFIVQSFFKIFTDLEIFTL